MGPWKTPIFKIRVRRPHRKSDMKSFFLTSLPPRTIAT
jgi:hypothetical protein